MGDSLGGAIGLALALRHPDRVRSLSTFCTPGRFGETADFQDFITRYAWGEVWTRPGLGRRSRRLLTLASLVTGGHVNELAMHHIRAALTNGLTRAEISEALLHVAIYAGLTASNAAFAIAPDVFAELDSNQTGK